MDLSSVDTNKISKIIKWREKRSETLENTAFLKAEQNDDVVEINGS